MSLQFTLFAKNGSATTTFLAAAKRFNIHAFHDHLRGAGSLPLGMPERRMSQPLQVQRWR